jgi:IS30 family transposase
MSKKHYCDNTHLSLNQRQIIQTGIENRSTKIAIAKTIGKDPTTVAKEIRKHRRILPRNLKRFPIDCKFLKICRNGCRTACDNYVKLTCKYRDKSPGACNKCAKSYACPMDKYYYDANRAHKAYEYDLVDSRQGINMESSQMIELAAIIDPLITQGQSPYQILVAHPEIELCEKTIYNYINQGIFQSKRVDLKEIVGRKEHKIKHKPRKESVNYEGRKYSDFLVFCENNLDVNHFEMDTVHNNPSGPYIQTMMLAASLMIGFIHQEKTSESMASTFDYLQTKLCEQAFNELLSLGLADRGPEYEKHHLFEFNSITGEARMNLFYCDAMCSWQKPHVENNHNYVRDILPNGTDLSFLTNEDLQLIFSHINSTPRRSLNGKSPYDLFIYIFTDENGDDSFGREILDALGIVKIEKDDIILKPYLLKTRK